MANVCVSCGAEIPDECGSMICAMCFEKAHSKNLDISLIQPKEKDIVLMSCDPHKITLEDARMVFYKLSETFSNNHIVVIPNSVSIDMVDEGQLKSLISRLEECYKNISNKEE